MKGDVFAFDIDSTLSMGIKFLKPCFLKHEDKKNLLISSDAQNWQEFSAFFSGKTDASLGMEKKFSPFANLAVELN
jgi:hypothetical protein